MAIGGILRPSPAVSRWCPWYDRTVTVAAVLAADPVDLLERPAGGSRWLDRLVDTAWAGGALPILVVARDPRGILQELLEGQPARGAPVPTMALDVILAAALAAGREAVADLSGLLLWPAEMVWVGPETITSLIERHGRARRAVLRPAFQGQPGWPLLLPAAVADAFGARSAAPRPLGDEGPGRWEAALAPLLTGAEVRLVELGDPGTVVDGTIPLANLPPYQGPPEPGAPPPEWGEAVAGEMEAAEEPVEEPRP
jgi:CTP:molybdopterin cytidylyltransferase MocA